MCSVSECPLQSCVMARSMLHLLHRTQSNDPSQSKLAALLHQHTELSRTHPPSSSTMLAAVTAELDTYTVYTFLLCTCVYIHAMCFIQCWQRLQVNTDHLDLLRYFPPHFRFFVLQHSEDKCVS